MVSKTAIMAIVVAAIVVVGGAGAYLLLSNNDDGGSQKISGIVIDNGDYDTEWKKVEFSGEMSALDALQSVTTVVMAGDAVSSVDGVAAQSGKTWDFWVLEGSQLVKKNNSYAIDATKCEGAVWALTESNGKPSPITDASGKYYYEYGQINSIICLVPSSSETLCAMGGLDRLIAVDSYSYYPDALAAKRNSNQIEVMGSYSMPPSAEAIFAKNPDLVIMEEWSDEAKKLRNLGVNLLVTSNGYTLDSVYDNMHMIGTVIGNSTEKNQIIEEIQTGIDNVMSIVAGLGSIADTKVLASMYPGWGTGPDSFIGEIITQLGAQTSISGGWTDMSNESAFASTDILILFTNLYGVNNDNYDGMLGELPNLWEASGADIYWLNGTAADVLARPGVRIAQAFELFAAMMYEDYPTHNLISGILSNKPIISDNYADCLQETAGLDFNIAA